MLHTLGAASLGTGFIFLMTALGAAVAFFLPERAHPGFPNAMLGFAAGVMTAASVWSLLIPAMERTPPPLPAYLPAAVGMIAGALFLQLLGIVLARAPQTADGALRENALLMLAVTLHNVPEGMAVGLAFALASVGEGLAAAWALALGIGIQNFPEGAAVALPLRRSGASRLRAFALGTLSGAVEPLFGLLAALAVSAAEALMPWLLSFAAGAMLCVTAEELLPQARSHAGTAGFLAGFLVMMVLDVALS
ncbi:MAG: ZIP family metal transporter [Oscillibacter sp.]|nr:ZIP family metal transporter [Oscillibacter sp.]